MSLPQPASTAEAVHTPPLGASHPRRTGPRRPAHTPPTAIGGGLSDILSRLTATAADWKLVRLGAGTGAKIPRGDFATIYMVADGELALTTSGPGSETLRRGDVAILLHGECHRIQAPGPGAIDRLVTLDHDAAHDTPLAIRLGSGEPAAEVLVGQLTLEWPSDLTPRGALPHLLTMHGSDRSAVGSVDVLLSHISATVVGAGGSAYLTKLSEIMIIKTLRLYQAQGGELLSGRQSSPDRNVERGVRLIDENIARPWTVAQLARSVGMSRSAFAAAFSRVVGQSPIDYVTEQRLQRAARMLTQPGHGIAEVSSSVGYQSAPAFTRRFKQRFGQSPGAYQRARLCDGAGG